MNEICEKTDLGQSELLSKATAAALKAIAENHFRITLPLKLEVVDETQKIESSMKLEDNKPPYGRK